MKPNINLKKPNKTHIFSFSVDETFDISFIEITFVVTVNFPFGSFKNFTQLTYRGSNYNLLLLLKQNVTKRRDLCQK